MRTSFDGKRWFAAVIAIALSVAPAMAESLDDLLQAHVDAIGGRARIEALTSMRATGQVVTGDKRLRFTMLAVRPNKVRIEIADGPRTVVQASDGRTPWTYDSKESPARYKDMPANLAKTFMADSEFNDPLVAGAKRGFTIDDAGMVTENGKKYRRLLVTKDLTKLSTLLLDPATLLIVSKSEDLTNGLGAPVHIVTRYEDYRPVAGVLVPHRVSLVVGSRLVQETKIETIEPNAVIADGLFSRPQALIVP